MEDRLNEERYGNDQYNLVTDDYFERSAFSNLTFRYVRERDAIIGTITDRDALEQSIFFILMTERYTYPIFNRDYGVDFDGIIGNSIEDVRTLLPQRIREALLVDNRITSVDEVVVQEIEPGVALVTIYIEDVFTQQAVLNLSFNYD